MLCRFFKVVAKNSGLFTKPTIRIYFHLDAENWFCAYLYTKSGHGWLGKSLVEVRQSHSSEEAPEQAGLAIRAEGAKRRGLTKRKHFQQENNRDTEHG
jgi:hypothetical protein